MKDIDPHVDAFIKNQVDNALDKAPDIETQQSIARLLIEEFLDRFDAEFAQSIVEIAKNFVGTFAALKQLVDEGKLIRTPTGHYVKPYKQ